MLAGALRYQLSIDGTCGAAMSASVSGCRGWTRHRRRSGAALLATNQWHQGRNVILSHRRGGADRHDPTGIRTTPTNATLLIGLTFSEARWRPFLPGATKASSNAAVTRCDTGCFDTGEKLAGRQGFEFGASLLCKLLMARAFWS